MLNTWFRWSSLNDSSPTLLLSHYPHVRKLVIPTVQRKKGEQTHEVLVAYPEGESPRWVRGWLRRSNSEVLMYGIDDKSLLDALMPKRKGLRYECVVHNLRPLTNQQMWDKAGLEKPPALDMNATPDEEDPADRYLEFDELRKARDVLNEAAHEGTIDLRVDEDPHGINQVVILRKVTKYEELD